MSLNLKFYFPKFGVWHWPLKSGSWKAMKVRAVKLDLDDGFSQIFCCCDDKSTPSFLLVFRSCKMGHQRFEGWESGKLYKKSRGMEIFLQIQQDLLKRAEHLSQQQLILPFWGDDFGNGYGSQLQWIWVGMGHNCNDCWAGYRSQLWWLLGWL